MIFRLWKSIWAIIKLMFELHKTTVIPQSLIVGDFAALEAKIANFVRVGAQGMHVIFDFDRTLTVKKPGSDDEVTTWHILGEHLPPEGKVEYKNLFQKYRGVELRGELTTQTAIDWWSASFELYIKYNINLADVEDDFLNKASIRPGVAELFELCAKHGIPTVILSAGIRDVIEIWCRRYKIEPSLIISTALRLDPTSRITGWREDTLVHVLNKSEATHAELIRIRSERPKTFLIGDSLDDATMASGDRDVIRIRVLDPRTDEVTSEQEIQKTLESFDALTQSGSLRPLLELVELISSTSQSVESS
jgi:HAD superfamily hydrolase (TIGR01544 family)